MVAKIFNTTLTRKEWL